MFRSGGWPRLAAALLCVLDACGSPPERLLPGSAPIEVTEVRRLVSCNSDGPQTHLYLLADRDAVWAWEHARRVDLIGVDPLPTAGAYVLVEMGVQQGGGYGLAISRRAQIDNGLVITLSASLLTPDSSQAATLAVTSPCVLVALPQGTYHGVDLRDPSGNLLGRADVAAAVQ